MGNYYIYFLILAFLNFGLFANGNDSITLSAAHWTQKSIETLKARMQLLKKAGVLLNKRRSARNLILMIGDGMGISTVSAIRKYKEQEDLRNNIFYKNQLSWDTFPFTGFAKTYETDAVVADGAGAATAYHCGTKTKKGYVGVDSTADEHCESDEGFVESIAARAQQVGKVSGFVTSAAITDASPAVLYAHSPHRDYESSNFDYLVKYPKCIDIAQQFVRRGQHIKVALGGGARNFLPSKEQFGADGYRSDYRHLIAEWLVDRSTNGKNAQFVWNSTDLLSVDRNVDSLLGLFSADHLPYVDDGKLDSLPTLAEMAEVAIDILNRNTNGYTLFIEAGRIDHGHHEGRARYALTEGLEFDRTVKKVLELVDLSETLVVVSADHSHTMTMGGKLSHSSSALGLSEELARDFKSYTSILYANGPGFKLVGSDEDFYGERPNVSSKEAEQRGYRQQAAVPLDEETHAAEDVSVYATGIYSQLFSGVFEQSHIAWAMSCAAGINGIKDEKMKQEFEQICPLPFDIKKKDTTFSSEASTKKPSTNFATATSSATKSILAVIAFSFRKFF